MGVVAAADGRRLGQAASPQPGREEEELRARQVHRVPAEGNDQDRAGAAEARAAQQEGLAQEQLPAHHPREERSSGGQQGQRQEHRQNHEQLLLLRPVQRTQTTQNMIFCYAAKQRYQRLPGSVVPLILRASCMSCASSVTRLQCIEHR